MKVRIEKRDSTIKTPIRATNGAGAYDFFTPEAFIIPPHNDIIINLGIRLQFNKKYALLEIERSSTAKSKCIAGAKFIDSDYRGFIHVHLINLSNKTIRFEAGDRVIQGVFLRIGTPKLIERRVSRKTERGEGSFGSTGK